jgi:SpoVK/Ycf46/Vps4 family AAA+-type ATPase
MPKFWDRISEEYNASSAHLFLLHFNVHDLAYDEVYGYLPMMYYLMEQLNVEGCDVVLGYSPSQGVIWPDIRQWRSVQRLLGLQPHEETWAEATGEIPPMGEFRPDGSFIPDQLGIAQIRATVGDISAESEPIFVMSDQIQRLQITPHQLEIESGKMFRFTLTAYDRQGRSIGVQHARWSVFGAPGGIGVITREGVFRAMKAGVGQVRAQLIGRDERAVSGEITVVPGKLLELKVADSANRRIRAQEPSTFELVGTDAHGNVINVENAQWEVIRADESGQRRVPINSRVIHSEIHKDPLIAGKLPPGKELREKFDTLLHQDVVKVGLVINFMERIIPNADLTVLDQETAMFLETFQRWALDFDVRLKKHAILLVTQDLSGVHPALAKNPDIPVVEIPLPSYDERLEFVEHLMNIPAQEGLDKRTQFTTPIRLAPDLTKEELAGEAAGLNLFGIHDVALRAEEARQPITRELVASYRRESVKVFSRGILQVSSPRAIDFESVVGLDHVVNVIRDIVDGMNEGDLRRVPRGMLFLGNPGTGKILAAELLAGHGNMTVIHLKNAIEYAASEGDARAYEHNVTFAINFIRALTPAVVCIEADHGTMRSDIVRDHPDSMLPIELLNAINDPSLHGEVIWIGISSRPDLMDPIFWKYGIFEYRLIFLPLSEVERPRILEMLCRGIGEGNQDINFGRVVAEAHTDDLSVRDFSIIVDRSYNIAKRNGRNALTEADLIEAMTDFVPDYSPEMNLFIGLLALREANSRSMLPRMLPPEYSEFLENNRIDKTAINQRLKELSGQLGLNSSH